MVNNWNNNISGWWWLEWNMTFIFHSVGNGKSSQLTIPHIFQRGRAKNHQPDISVEVFFHGNSNLPPTVTELFNFTVSSAPDSLGTEHPCLGQQQLLESFLLSRWWHSAKGTEGHPRGRTSKKDLECVESCKRDEKKLRLLSRWGSSGAKIGLWKKTGSYRDLNQNFGRFPWIWMAATVLLISHYRYLQGTAVHRFWSSIFFSAHRFVRKNGHRFNSTSSDSSYGGRRSTEMWKRWRLCQLCRLGRLGVSSQAPVLKFCDPKTLSKAPGDLLW